jgi:hypothetical protein
MLLASNLFLFGVLVSGQQEDRYLQPEAVNTTDLLTKIAQLPLTVHTFKYDRLARRQLGVTAPELTSILPSAVTTLPSQPYPNPDSSGPKVISVPDFQQVDSSVLFMHNVGATQELNRESKAMKGNIEKIEDESAAVIAEMARINTYLDEEAAKAEAKQNLEAEQEANRKAAHIEKASQVCEHGVDLLG